MTMDYGKAKELIPVLDDLLPFDEWKEFVLLARKQCAGALGNNGIFQQGNS